MRATSLFGLLSLSLIAGCSAAPTDSTSSASTDDALSSANPTYVAIRQDMRRCAAPLCGGFWVHDVNHNTAEQYVAALDFVKSGLDDATIAKVTSAPANEIVLNGRLSTNRDPNYGTRTFLVFGAYRGMPGITYQDGASFYTANDFNPPVECFRAPCPEGKAQKLNSTAYPKTYEAIDVSAAKITGFVDDSWMLRQVTAHGAIVVGTVTTVNDPTFGNEQVLAAQQVFIKLPLQTGPCPEIMTPVCPSDTPVETFTRTPDFCMEFVSCVTQHPCPLMMPYCPDGYVLTQWKTDPNGCNASVCDPAFIH